MAMIKGVFVSTVSPLDCCITRAQERITTGNSLGLPVFSCGACRKQQHKKVSILKRGSNGVALELIKFGPSGRNWGRCCKEWKRTIPIAADRSQRQRGCCIGAGGGGRVSAVAEEMGVMDGDVVEYPLAADPGVGQVEGKDSGRRIGVGVIVDLLEDSDVLLCQIEPLCQEDPGSKEWIHDELQPEITVPIGQVRVLQAWYSQRMVPDRISNPHGEHAENLWILE